MALSYINNKEIKFGSSKPLNGVYTPGSPTREYEPLDSLGIYLNSGIPLSYGVENNRYMSMSDKFAATSQGNSYSFNQFFAAQMVLGFKLHDRFIACDTEHKIIGTEPLLQKAYLAEITEKTLDYFKIKIYGDKTRTFCIRMSASEVPTSYVDLTNSFDESGLNLTQTDRQSFLSYYRFYPLTARDFSSRAEETLGVDYYLLPSAEGLKELSGDILSKFNAFISSDGSTLTNLGNTAFAYAGDINYVLNYKGETPEAAVSAAKKAEVILGQVEEMHAGIIQILPEMEENLELTKQYRDEAMSTEIGTVREDVNQLKGDLDNLEKITTDEYLDVVNLTSSMELTTGYISTDGFVSGSESYVHTGIISVNEGDIFENRETNYRFVCAYDNDGNAIESKGATSVATYTVPNGVSKIALSFNSNYERGSDTVIRTRKEHVIKDLHSGEIEQLLSSVNGNELNKSKGSMIDGTKFIIEANSIRKSNTIRFLGKISLFDSIKIGHGESGNHADWVTIDGTKIYFVSGGSLNHGLTIDTYIAITIEVDANCIATYKIDTLGGSYKRTVQAPSYFLGCDGNIFAESIGSRFTFAELTWNAEYQKNKWAFGDSYFSNYSDKRWTYYLQKWGYDNTLLNAHPGENSEQAYDDWTVALTHGTPKYAIWCLGMNDEDSDTEINASWKTYVDKFIADCESKGITPILATIPNVPNINHTFKNEYVRNLGYRYIDFADAVGANEKDSTWYTSCLSSDNVHPDVEGAKLLAIRALSDFPEFMQE